jgi:hypothetical protein
MPQCQVRRANDAIGERHAPACLGRSHAGDDARLPPARWFTMSKSAGAMRRPVDRLLWGPLASTRAGQSTPQVWHAPRGAWIRSGGAWSEWAAASVRAPEAGRADREALLGDSTVANRTQAPRLPSQGQMPERAGAGDLAVKVAVLHRGSCGLLRRG